MKMSTINNHPNRIGWSVVIIIIVFFGQSVSAREIAWSNAMYFQDTPQTQQDLRSQREIERAANQVLRGSIELFNEGAYWNSARELIILMDYYPNYNKLDEVIFYLGQCLFEENLSTSAIRLYKYLLKKYPDSPFAAAALLGLEKAYYLQENYKLALSIYFAILKKNPANQELLNTACYYAGLSHFNLKNYDMAISVLKKIDSHSDYYDCALYTTALSYLKKSDVATAVDYFRKVIALPIVSGERRNIVDNSRLTLGYIYYELKTYQPAISLFLDISNKHDNYQDALLALGWACLKIEDYENVIKHLEKLIKLFPESANAEEAYFLLGQAHIARGNYDAAIRSYQTIVDIYQGNANLPTLVKKVSTSLDQEAVRVEKLKVQVLIEESRLLDAIALDGYGENVPRHVIEEKKKLKDYRENLISHLLAERDHLLLMQQNIRSLKKLAERRELRKDWRGYAEYGISRALFLKNMKTARGN